MGFLVRSARVILVAAIVAGVVSPSAANFPAAGSPSLAATPSPKEIFQGLNGLRIDPARVYFVRDLNLRRDVVRLSFIEGKLAFFQAYNGRVLGAVFTGRGRALAVPRNPADKRTLALFLNEPILDQGITRAYLRFTDESAAELARQVEQSGARRIDEAAFVEEWNLAVANLNPWHSLRTMADMLSSQPMPYFYAGVAGEVSGPFDMLVDDRLREQVVLGQGQWMEGVRYNDVWASFPRSGAEPQPFEEQFIPKAYEIETTIHPDHSLDGRAVVTLESTRDGERAILFELSRHLEVSSLELLPEKGGASVTPRPMEFFQNEEINRREIAERGNDTVYAVLPEPARTGNPIRIRMRYRGTVISDAGNGVLFVGDRGNWYPRLGGNDRFTNFDLAFRWPAKLQLVATGKKISEKEAEGWKTGQWKSDVPIGVAGFNLGEYSRETAEAGGVRIEVFANQMLEQTLKTYLERPTVYRTPRMPVGKSSGASRLYIGPGARAPSPTVLLKQMARNFADATTYFETLHGRFPFESLAISQIPGSFGQGWPGLLYLSSLAFLPKDAQERAGMGTASQELYSDIMPYHELAHQWWGNVVGWPSYRDQWIVEGLANYDALLYADAHEPQAKLMTEWLDRYRTDLTTKLKDREITVDEAGPVVMGFRLRSSQVPSDAYNTIVYGKSTWIIHMLRMMLRDPKAKDPDARFFALLRGLLKDYRFAGLTTEKLEKEIEKRMIPAMDIEGDHKMEWFFDQYVRGTGIPKYEIEFTARAQANGALVRGKLKQENVPASFTAPVPIFFRNAAGRLIKLGTVISNGEETPFQFSAPEVPKRLVVDPERTLLCTPPN